MRLIRPYRRDRLRASRKHWMERIGAVITLIGTIKVGPKVSMSHAVMLPLGHISWGLFVPSLSILVRVTPCGPLVGVTPRGRHPCAGLL